MPQRTATFPTDAFWYAFRAESVLPSLWVQSFWLLYRQDLRPFLHGSTLHLPTPEKGWDQSVASSLATWEEKLEEPTSACVEGFLSPAMS